MRGDMHALLTVLRLRERFGDDCTLAETYEILKRENAMPRRRGRPDKWDDGIAGDVYLMVRAIMAKGFGQTEAQLKLAEFEAPKGGWFSFREVRTGFDRGKKYLSDLSDREIEEHTAVILDAMPLLKTYIETLRISR
jgi:hypothetical protein